MSLLVDALAFLGPSLYGGGQDVEAITTRMSSLGIDATVVVPARPPEYALGPANDFVARVQASSAGTLTGLARVDPNQPRAAADLSHVLGELGLRGLFLHPLEEGFRVNDTKVVKVVEACAEHHLPVVVAAGYPWVSEALQVADLARLFPELSFVMTNGGQFNISGLGQLDAQMALASCPNLSIQTTGVYRQDFIERMVAQFGPERVMYAGGSPRFEPEYEILRVRWSRLDESARQLLLGRNAARVFGVDARE